LVIVSAERIAEEMRKMLRHRNRARAVQLLQEAGLIEIVLPEAKALENDENVWQRTSAILDALEQPSFPVALAAFARELGERDDPNDRLMETVGGRWRLSNDEIEEAAWVRRHESAVRQARRVPWPRLQRILIGPFAHELLVLAHAVAQVEDGSTDDIDFCRAKLALPPEELNPRPLLTGNDLIAAGRHPGPKFQVILEAVRNAQLEGKISTREEALDLATRLADEQ
jgi:tRNA nucleotidyltransferase/poly(A) polymerase